MDEPTSSLTLTETNRLLEIIAELKASGVSVIFITHRLNEIEQCADRVVALRDGAVVGTLPKAEIEHDRMIRLMIGRDLKALYTPPKVPPGDEILIAQATFAPRPIPIVRSISRCGAARSSASPAWSAPGGPSWRATIFGIDRPVDGTMRGRRSCRSRSDRPAMRSRTAST